MKDFSSALWVVTPYFNPAGYRRRLDNFRAFRKQLNVPLLVVELARPGKHQLSEDDADVIIQLTGEDRLWQKERLINIGVHALPRKVEYVAWVDCDLVFEDENWPTKAIGKLESKGGLLQAFHTVAYLPRTIDSTTATLRQCMETRPLMTGISAIEAAKTSLFDKNEQLLADNLASYDARLIYSLQTQYNCPGMAWAAARSQFEECGLFDANIIGGGDSLMAFAALGRIDQYWRTRPSSPKLRAHANAWIEKAKAAGLLGARDNLNQRVFHLWHGEIADRNYRGRLHVLVECRFDPLRDLELAENGTWRWSAPAGEIARRVGDYFFARREDGDASIERAQGA